MLDLPTYYDTYVVISNRRSPLSHTPTKEELAKLFDEKQEQLIAELQAWYLEETEAIDGSVQEATPSGDGGSIVTVRPAIDSKRVVDATLITETVLGIQLPPEIIKPGGYQTFEEMTADIVPKLKQVFTGELKVKKPSMKQKAEVEQ
jgi:hypothetical protein